MVVEFEKYADPTKKERLLSSKKAWNEIVKLLIAKLIAFKRGINGKGDDDAHLPEVDIKDPFPVEFQTYLSSIVDDYDRVIKGADFLINLQEDFSVNRRKGREELEQMSSDDKIIAEASWWGSQSWAWLNLFRLDKDTRKIRLKMITWSKKAIDALKTIEYYFNKGDDLRAIVGYVKFLNLFVGGLLRRFEQLKKVEMRGLQLPEGVKADEVGDPSVEPKLKSFPSEKDIGDEIVSGEPPSGPSMQDIKVDFGGGILKNRVESIINGTLDSNKKAVIQNLFERLRGGLKPNGELSGKLSEDEVIDIYLNLKNKLNSAEASGKSALTEQEEMRKIAQNILERWLAKKKFQWKGKNKSDDIKEQITDELRDAIKSIDKLMNTLEDVEKSNADIDDNIKEVGTLLFSAAEMTLWLADDYRLEWKLEDDKNSRGPKLDSQYTSILKKLMGMLPRNG